VDTRPIVALGVEIVITRLDLVAPATRLRTAAIAASAPAATATAAIPALVARAGLLGIALACVRIRLENLALEAPVHVDRGTIRTAGGNRGRLSL
ncbi:MAG TPA: hypothetical protein PK857_12175, partial [Hyphomicrobium sp.]|nr:hypothetical protein [Hyphomicrobium sp.]